MSFVRTLAVKKRGHKDGEASSLGRYKSGTRTVQQSPLRFTSLHTRDRTDSLRKTLHLEWGSRGKRVYNRCCAQSSAAITSNDLRDFFPLRELFDGPMVEKCEISPRCRLTHMCVSRCKHADGTDFLCVRARSPSARVFQIERDRLGMRRREYGLRRRHVPAAAHNVHRQRLQRPRVIYGASRLQQT